MYSESGLSEVGGSIGWLYRCTHGGIAGLSGTGIQAINYSPGEASLKA
jgi:hypothetical protein